MYHRAFTKKNFSLHTAPLPTRQEEATYTAPQDAGAQLQALPCSESVVVSEKVHVHPARTRARTTPSHKRAQLPIDRHYRIFNSNSKVEIRTHTFTRAHAHARVMCARVRSMYNLQQARINIYPRRYIYIYTPRAGAYTNKCNSQIWHEAVGQRFPLWFRKQWEERVEEHVNGAERGVGGGARTGIDRGAGC